MHCLWIAPDTEGLPKLRWLEELGRLNQIPGVTLTPVTGKVSRQDVAIALSKKSDVVVWSGHGQSGGLVLSDGSIVEGQWLGVRLANPATAPRVVVLAACASQEKDISLSSLTATISRKGVTVIGFPAQTDDKAASDFIIEFVGAMTVTTPMQAFDVAIQMIAKTPTAKGVFLMNAASDVNYRVQDELGRLYDLLIEIRSILLHVPTPAPTMRGSHPGEQSMRGIGMIRAEPEDEPYDASLEEDESAEEESDETIYVDLPEVNKLSPQIDEIAIKFVQSVDEPDVEMVVNPDDEEEK